MPACLASQYDRSGLDNKLRQSPGNAGATLAQASTSACPSTHGISVLQDPQICRATLLGLQQWDQGRVLHFETVIYYRSTGNVSAEVLQNLRVPCALGLQAWLANPVT